MLTHTHHHVHLWTPAAHPTTAYIGNEIGKTTQDPKPTLHQIPTGIDNATHIFPEIFI